MFSVLRGKKKFAAQNGGGGGGETGTHPSPAHFLYGPGYLKFKWLSLIWTHKHT